MYESKIFYRMAFLESCSNAFISQNFDSYLRASIWDSILEDSHSSDQEQLRMKGWLVVFLYSSLIIGDLGNLQVL